MSLDEECSQKQDQERALLALYIHEQRTETQHSILAELPKSENWTFRRYQYHTEKQRIFRFQ